MTTAVPTTADEVTEEWLGEQLGVPVRLQGRSRVGEAHGFASQVVRVRGQHDDGRFDLVVKLTGAVSARRESWFLGHIGPSLPLPLPRVWSAVHDADADRGALVMDHLTGRQGDVLHPVAAATLGRLVEGLAVLHVRFAGARDEVLDAVGSDPRPQFRLRPERLEALRRHRPELLDDRVELVLGGVAEAAAGAHAHLLAGPRTLVHGDVHLDNVLLRDEGRPVLLDWEGVRVGTAAEDVAGLAVAPTPSGPFGIDRAVAVHRAAIAEAGGTADPEMEGRVVSALVALTAGVTNWVGRLAAEPHVDERQWRVAEAGLRELTGLLAPHVGRVGGATS